ncbi:hypothetical protein ACFV0L_06130 [Streptosporangium canum]|uniref:hypothetical protein n=1 Tax=Streptosporangium canum TaxID=324952 RepID=UPI0036B58DD8
MNRLAAEKNMDEYAYATLFTEQEFQGRERADDMAEYDSTTAIDRALREDQQAVSPGVPRGGGVPHAPR